MTDLTSITETRSPRQAAGEEIAGLLAGTGFTLLLFLGMAHFENFGSARPAAEIEELHMVAAPFEPPPPTPKLEEAVPEELPPLAGIEIGASDSPVRIAVVPPDLAARMPEAMIPPRARLQSSHLYAELKPRAGVEVELNHVFQESEVDQMPRVLVRAPPPPIPQDARAGASSLRVSLLVLIGRDGRPESVRVAQSSGSPRFDALIAQSVQEGWVFSPALRRGKKVRVLAQQPFRLIFPGGGNPFDVN